MSYEELMLSLCFLALLAQGCVASNVLKTLREWKWPEKSHPFTPVSTVSPVDKHLWRVAGKSTIVREGSPAHTHLVASGAKLTRMGE